MKKLLLYLMATIVVALFLVNTNSAIAQNNTWVNVVGFEPGSAVIPNKGKESLRELVADYNPSEKTIRIIGMADTLGWKGMSPQAGESADTTLAYQRAEVVSDFYQSIGWRTEIITVQNFRPNFRGYRGVQVSMTEASEILEPLASGNLVLMITTVTEDEKISEEHVISGNDIVEDWQKDGESRHEIIINLSTESTTTSWYLNTGVRVWSSRSSQDLLVPVISLGFHRKNWAISAGGGYAPWEKNSVFGSTKDGLVFVEIISYPERELTLKGGFLIGWEFLSETDHWVTKVESLFIGPTYRWRFLEASLVYTPARITTLTKDPFWQSGILAGIEIKIN